MTGKVKAYHFLKDDMCNGYGNETPWKVDEKRTVEGELQMCRWGYHASPSWYDALLYARGTVACLVELSGETQKDASKYVARTRKLVDARNAEKVLRMWACDCAERALKKAEITDERSWNAIKIAQLYNECGATREELRVARDAAEAAARDATRDAARDAAREVPWVAAKAVAWSMTRVAAKDAEIRWRKSSLNKLMKELFNSTDERM